jgi:hypothetical protein
VAARDQRKALAADRLDERDLPQRAPAREPLGEHVAGELRELALACGAGQREQANVMLERDGRRDPDRPGAGQRHPRERAGEGGRAAEPRADVLDQLAKLGRRAVEEQHAACVERPPAAAFEVQRGCLGGG